MDEDARSHVPLAALARGAASPRHVPTNRPVRAQPQLHRPPAWVEYLEEEQCFLLDDNRSVGAVFELQPIGTEGVSPIG
jgi:hypothetical protein